MYNIAIQSGIFQLKSSVRNKDYQIRLKQLRRIDEILDVTGIETEFVAKYLSEQQLGKQSSLTSKEHEKYTVYATEALRCNILFHLLNESTRSLSITIASSEDYRCFIHSGNYYAEKSPSKTRLNNFQRIFPASYLQEISSKLVLGMANSDISEKLNLESPIKTDVIWSDSTCLMSKIHFPVDWVLLKDIIISLMTTIKTLRKHGLKNRLPKSPEEFINEINNLSMQMTFTRRQVGGKKRRKELFRLIKKLCRKVVRHGELYRDLLKESYTFKTDLSCAQVMQFVKRMDNVISQSSQAIKIAHARLITGIKTPHKDKIFSLFDDSATLIVRGKSGAEVEFGNELLISEQENGLITSWKLYRSKTSDTKKFDDILCDIKSSKYGITVLVTDRGFYSKNNSKKLDKEDIYDGMLPKNVKLHEERIKEEKFRLLQKRRSQTEARVAIVKQYTGSKLKQKRFENKEAFVGWSILVHNLIGCTKLKEKEEGSDEIEKIAS